MGKMKEVCIQIMNANDGIPEGMTIGDVARMRDLEIYNWEEYEREAERRRVKFIESENSTELKKVTQANHKFSSFYGEAREEKGDKQ
jgi:hypothetical protein